MNKPILTISELNAGYAQLSVLFNVNLEITDQTITVLIGPNGAGKSTILKSIFNLTNITSGSIKWQNKELIGLKPYQLISLGISYIAQGRPVFSGLTVEENLKLGAYILKDNKVVEKNIQEVLTQFPDLKDKLKQPARSLSGGQQQMLALGMALMQTPKLLLLDEPSLGLSPKALNEVFQKIVEIKNSGTAVLIVEQNAKQAAKIADQIYLLENGRIVLTGGKEVLEDKKIKQVYLGGV